MGSSGPDAAGSLWWSSALVAAIVAGIVSLATVWITEARRAKDRRRRLFAEAFAATVRYREFVYRVRRRKDDGADERIRLSEALSDVQEDLAIYQALLRVEDPRVGAAYSNLVTATRDVAGRQIAEAWKQKPLSPRQAAHIGWVDLSGIGPHEDAYLLAVNDFLSSWPCWLRRAVRAARNRLRRDGDQQSGPGDEEPSKHIDPAQRGGRAGSLVPRGGGAA